MKELRFVDDLKALAAQRDWTYRAFHPSQAQLSQGSRTIPPVLQRLLHQAPQIMADYFHAKRTKTSEAAYKQFTNLLSTRYHDSPESFTCVVPGALVAGPEGLVITDQGEILTQAITRVHKDRGEIKVLVAFSRPSSPPHMRVQQRCVPLITLGRIAYAHWMIQALPRLDLLDISNADDADLRFLVPAEMRPFQRQSLALLGIPEDRWIGVAPGHNVLADQLLVCAVENGLFKPKAAHLLAVRDRLWKAAGITGVPAVPGRRLYISRAKAKRPVVNEQELLPVLHAYGFEPVILEELSLAQQIRLVWEADLLCGPHGAGMYNSIFARPGATVIEIFNPAYWDVSSVRIASYAHLRHWHMLGENVSPDFDTYVDPEVFSQLLDTVMRYRENPEGS